MKKIPLIFLIAFFVFFITNTTQSYAQYDCDDVPLPNVKFTYDTGKVSFNHNLDFKGLSNLRKKNGLPNDDHLLGHNGGLTIADMFWKVNNKIDTSFATNHDVCVFVKDVNVNVGFNKIDVYVSKNYPVGSCEYEMVLQHENAHAYIHQLTLEQYTHIAERTALEMIAYIDPIQVKNHDEVTELAKVMSAQVDEMLKPAIQFLQEKQNEFNMLLDSDENYEYTANLCSNW